MAMRLVIHAGLRKTATSAFQLACYHCRAEGIQAGVLYPELKFQAVPALQHSPLLWALQEHRRLAVFCCLRQFFEEAQCLRCTTVLLSGEDFENLLVDASMHRLWEQLVQAAGFSAPEWWIVERDPMSRFASLYAEYAKHGICVAVQAWAASVKRTGWFTLSTENCHYAMVIDLPRLLPAFSARCAGSVSLISFDDFTGMQPAGAAYLMQCFGLHWLAGAAQSAAQDSAKLHRSRNARLSADAVELSYLKNYLRSGLVAADQVDWVEVLLRRLGEARTAEIVTLRQQRLESELAGLRRFFA